MSTAVRSIRGRTTFSQFKRPSGRGSAGPVRVRYLGPTSDCTDDRPAVAFAVGRRTGTAVTRNRIRRRLRAALQELPTDTLGRGCYLVGADAPAASVPFRDLVGCLEEALAVATGAAGDRSRRPGR